MQWIIAVYKAGLSVRPPRYSVYGGIRTMKKIVVTLLLAAILLTMTPMSATLAEASYATVQSGNQYGVRLRLGPSTSYASQTTMPSCTVVTVL